MVKTSQISSLGFLVHAQGADGSFVSFTSPNPQSFDARHSYQTTFATSHIITALSSLSESPDLKIITKKGIGFLLKQRSPEWSWNYWARDSKEYRKRPYPDDLDDTFSALSALTLLNRQVVDASVMAHVVSLLTTLEKTEGGPYRTWLVKPSAPPVWRDVDIAVNANIAYFLSLHDITLPKLISFIESSIEKNELVSSYYPDELPVIYFISRWYRGKKKNNLKALVLHRRKPDGSWGSPLSTALALSSLGYLGFLGHLGNLTESSSYLRRARLGDHWAAEAFCLDPAIEGKKYYAGSDALTTAFCLEALSVSAKCAVVESKPKMKEVDLQSRRLREKVVNRVMGRFRVLKKPLSAIGIGVVEKIIQADVAGYVTLLPFFFRQSLKTTFGSKVSDEVVTRLGMVNVFGWTAYTIYDHIMDRQSEADLLPVANICLREASLLLYGLAPRESGFSPFVSRVFDEMEEANAWELVYTKQVAGSGRMPRYGSFDVLSKKSFGHALAPIAILCLLGYSVKSRHVRRLSSFFRHYLIARQLNDDAHDWLADLSAGRINSVSALIFENTTIKPTAKKEVLQKIFWDRTVDVVATQVAKHVRLAYRDIRALSLFTHYALFDQMVLPLEKSLVEALKSRSETHAFLTALRKP